MGPTGSFLIRVGSHHSLRPYPFGVIVNVFVSDIKEQAPRSMLFVDDIVWSLRQKKICKGRAEAVALDDHGLRIDRTKTEYLRFSESLKLET